MQPSSLVFLVIIAVWAAYFVQYWVRRREHLATARSVDQFSESMRVLERRSPLPASNLSMPQPRSYAVTPARVVRPQVLVKRAETSPTTQSSSTMPTAPTGPATATAPTAPRVAREATVPRVQPTARRTRAVIMLGALASVLVVGTLVALSVLPLTLLAVPVLAVGGALAWSRATAQAERRARMAARQAHRRASQLRPLVEPTARPAEPTAPPAEPSADLEPVTTPEPSTVVRDELYDVQAVESERVAAEPVAAEQAAATPAVPAGPLVDDDDIPLTWDPVPVPRPTYTMKARVTRPAPTSADLVGDADTEYAAYDEAPERRVAGA